MPDNQFINLEELSKTTQALLSKINEQSNLKVNKHNVKSELSDGTKIGSIEGVEFYAPPDISNILSNVAYSGNYRDLNDKPIFAKVATSGSYNDLNDKPTIPTKTSDLTNDSGYLTSYTETDPTVPAWAKAKTKPAYTASDIPGLQTLS